MLEILISVFVFILNTTKTDIQLQKEIIGDNTSWVLSR